MDFEAFIAAFNVWSTLIVSFIAITIALTKHRAEKYAHSGTLLLNFKNTIFDGNNLKCIKPSCINIENKSLLQKKKRF